MNAKEIIAELRHFHTSHASHDHRVSLNARCADMLEAQFLAAERDAEAIRQLRESVTDRDKRLVVADEIMAELGSKIDGQREAIAQLRAALAAAKEAIRSSMNTEAGWLLKARDALAKIEALSP